MSATIHLSGTIRSRKLDFRKPLSIHHSTTLADLDQESLQNKITSIISTGVEREEEAEVHLVVALESRDASIPTPQCSVQEVQGTGDWVQGEWIVYSGQYVCGGYCADEGDIEWSKENSVPIETMEGVFEGLERLAAEKIDSSLPDVEEFERVAKIEYPQLKLEKFAEAEGVEHDSYVCFRKRDPRTLRKTRRNDTVGLDKLRRLNDEMRHASELLSLVVKREETRRAVLAMHKQVFEARIAVRRIKHILGISTADVDTSPEKTLRTRGTRIKIPLARIKESLVGGEGVIDRIKRRRLLDANEGWCEFAENPFQLSRDSAFWSDLPVSPPVFDQPVLYRRRIGRGGRVIFDRYTASHLKYDQEDFAVHQLLDSARFTAYRALTLAPSTEQECRSLMNKPTFPDAINTLPQTHAQRLAVKVAAVERACSPLVKRKRTVVDVKPVKKKVVENLNPREQAVRKLLHDSQVQAAAAAHAPRPPASEGVQPQPRFFLPNHRLAPTGAQFFRKDK